MNQSIMYFSPKIRIMKKIGKIILASLILLFLIGTLPYYWTNIFNFSEPKPFQGEVFYNPYKNISKSWIKANLHAHSILHHGLAYGQNTPEELFHVYDSMNYDLACISNYNNMSIGLTS